MTSHSAAVDDLVPPRPGGRLFDLEMRALLADCAPSGRMRLDAIARWVQDIAYADVEDAGVADHAFWVVRRTRIDVQRFPRFGERLKVTTFCSGIGRMWAERRTTITHVTRTLGGGEPPLIEAVSLWIHLDPERRVPSLLTQRELDMYGSSAGDRHVHYRLRHPRPERATPVRDWTFRETDCDMADHVNNAAYWEPLEEELLERERTEGRLRSASAEIEFRNPAQPGPKAVLADREFRWIVDPGRNDSGSGEFYASTMLMNAETTLGSN